MHENNAVVSSLITYTRKRQVIVESDFATGAAPWSVTLRVRPIHVAYTWPLCEYMTLSTKPEVYNLMH